MSKEQLSPQLGNEQLKKISVADPLEGVIEGNTRQERYTRFINEVIVQIWSPDKQSGNFGEYNDDLFRSTRFSKGDVHAYTQSSPFGIDPQFLSNEQFETVVTHLDTPDYVRVRSVPPQLFDKNSACVPTGGSCVIETHGMRTINEIQKGIKENQIQPTCLTDVVRQLIDLAPTITHISGALLGGHTHAVHYIESDMWAEKITDYGVSPTEAYQIVNDAYERIHDAVSRRTLLINPEATLIPVNFDELDLTHALHEWFHTFDMVFDPSYRVAEVIYTYDGPKQLDLLKNALRKQLENNQLGEKEKSAIKNILQSSYHMRVKQTDHLRWGSMKLPKEFIMALRPLTQDEQEKYEKDYAYRMGIHIMKEVYKAHKNNSATSIAVGFADLPSFYNEVQHESRNVGVNFRGKPGDEQFAESVKTYINSPARLNRNNVVEHLAFLRSYTVHSENEQKNLLLREMNELRYQLSPFEIALKTSQRALNSFSQKMKHKKTIDHDEYRKAQQNFNEAQTNYNEHTEIHTRLNQVKITLSEMNGPHCFPLNDNPFIHHAMQFLWDSDFVVFMKDAVEIQSKYEKKDIQKDEAMYQLKILTAKIYPKLESYIHYLYGKIEYPHAMRNSKIMT